MIAVVDYGASNLASVVKAFRAAGADPRIVRTPADLAGARGIVIPGVGHFEATRALDAGWRSAILAAIRPSGGSDTTRVSLLGICLGMQWLYSDSEEAPGLDGLGIFEGRIRRLTGPVKIPHVGWNTLARRGQSSLLEGVADGTAVYFTHSFAAPVSPEALAISQHGVPFSAIVERGNVAGMQFHPEKSGAAGLKVLRNWSAALKGCATPATNAL